jgi:hypothetical protein
MTWPLDDTLSDNGTSRVDSTRAEQRTMKGK